MRAAPLRIQKILVLKGLVADHESYGAGGFYCETTGASRKLFLRGPEVNRKAQCRKSARWV